MEHRKLVLPEHMNDHGVLFGGFLLKWLDEFAYMTASLEFPGHRFVTVAMHDVKFEHSVPCGEILCYAVEQSHLGNTSVSYVVRVSGQKAIGKGNDGVFFETQIVFVNTTEAGEKAPIRS